MSAPVVLATPFTGSRYVFRRRDIRKRRDECMGTGSVSQRDAADVHGQRVRPSIDGIVPGDDDVIGPHPDPPGIAPQYSVKPF